MRKKILSCMLAIAVLSGMAGCGDGTGNTDALEESGTDASDGAGEEGSASLDTDSDTENESSSIDDSNAPDEKAESTGKNSAVSDKKAARKGMIDIYLPVKFEGKFRNGDNFKLKAVYNNNGLMTRFEKSVESGNNTDAYIYSYEYNTDRLIIKEASDDGGAAYYEYSNGQLVSSSEYYGGSADWASEQCSYYSDTGLVKSRSMYRVSDEYTYDFNDNGNLSRIKNLGNEGFAISK